MSLFLPISSILASVRFSHRSPLSLNKPVFFPVLPSLSAPLFFAFKKQLVKVDAATPEVTDGVNLALRNSSACAHEGGGQEEKDRTLFSSYTRNLKYSCLESALEVIA